MSLGPTTSGPTVASPPALPSPVARMERRLRVLEELTYVGLQLTQVLCVDAAIEHQLETGTLRDIFGDKLTPQALADAAAIPRRVDPAALFATISRAIRLTVTLEMRVEKALAALQSGAAAAPAAPAENRSTTGRDARAAAAEDGLDDLPREAGEREADNFGDLDAFERALDERLERDPADGGFKGLPVEETARRLSAELHRTDGWRRPAREARARDRAPPAPSPADDETRRRGPDAAPSPVTGPPIESRRPLLE